MVWNIYHLVSVIANLKCASPCMTDDQKYEYGITTNFQRMAFYFSAPFALVAKSVGYSVNTCI